MFNLFNKLLLLFCGFVLGFFIIFTIEPLTKLNLEPPNELCFCLFLLKSFILLFILLLFAIPLILGLCMFEDAIVF